MYCANGGDHLHHIQAMQRCAVLLKELADHNLGNDMAL
jgi:hypothetical protein